MLIATTSKLNTVYIVNLQPHSRSPLTCSAANSVLLLINQTPKPNNIMSNHLKGSLFSSLLCMLLSAYFLFLLFFLNFNSITLHSIHPPLLSHTTHDDDGYLLQSECCVHPKNHDIITRIVESSSHSHSSTLFHARVRAFFNNENSSSSFSYTSCRVRFFMTWIFPLEKFGGRDLLSIESLFKSNPEACLLIVSEFLDSHEGTQIVRPFLMKGFRVMAIAPDFNYLFKDTPAESWLNQLKAGKVDAGKVYLGQNLSNLVRLALMYKFGGIYIDTDVIVLKSFSMLRNTIGAQSIHAKTGQWRTLNNAVLVFDKGHPLIWEFIKEFGVTFNGSQWGHNGPDLITRVVSRVSSDGMIPDKRFNFSIMPPYAFYPVRWFEIRKFFKVARDEIHSERLSLILEKIHNQSLALHLWKTQSWYLKLEKGSIVDIIRSSCCIFCNSWN